MSLKLKVGVYYGPGDIRCEEMPRPKLIGGDVLVEMKACGICGSDLMDWYLVNRAPLVLGHEPVGIVVEVSRDVKKFEVGDRVFAHHHVACCACHYCVHGDYTLCEQFRETHLDPGGFSEYFRVPTPNVKMDTFKIPKHMSFEEATLIEPVACGIKAMVKCNIKPGDVVAVIGAGPAGIINLMLSKILGASKTAICDLIEYRLKMARKFGADLIVDPSKESFSEAVKSISEGRGADAVIVTAPNKNAIELGVEVCRKGGTLCLFAPTPPNVYVKLSPHKLFFNEIKIMPSYSTSHIETRMALNLIASKRLKVKELITHKFKLENISEAFELASKIKECLKVIIVPR